jgi:pimeloyl-ACP methyl ester carboxylesterase
MKSAVILHGLYDKSEYYDRKFPSPSNAHWLPWLQRQLQLQDVKADTPEVYLTYKASWEEWCREVERFEMDDNTILVGHSMGGGFWVKYLSLHMDLRVGKVVLVAPWLDPDGDETKGFFDDYEMDPKLVSRTAGITIFNSDNDMGNVLKSVAAIREGIQDVKYKEFRNYGHFTYGDMKTVEFPELLQECMSGVK